MTKISRNEQLRRAAEMRAAISSVIANSTKDLSSKEIGELLVEKMKELEYSNDNLSNFLFSMSRNNLIYSKGTLGHIVYGKFPSTTQELDKEKSKKSKTNNGNKLSATEEIKIDIVKSSGRVRLQIKGLLIEIGVVD